MLLSSWAKAAKPITKRNKVVKTSLVKKRLFIVQFINLSITCLLLASKKLQSKQIIADYAPKKTKKTQKKFPSSGAMNHAKGNSVLALVAFCEKGQEKWLLFNS
jgi:fucose 4-O-acetylase-like acetyltransferase